MSARHTLRAQVGTVHRGVFDATLAPVLTIASGDVVEVTTLSGNPDQIPPPELGFTVLPEHQDVLARVPTGEGPHLLTGPIAVDGALPGDELVVEVLDMKLAQNWGWNRLAPGMGALPEQVSGCAMHPHRHRPRGRHGDAAMGAQAQRGAVLRHHRRRAAARHGARELDRSARLRRQYR